MRVSTSVRAGFLCVTCLCDVVGHGLGRIQAAVRAARPIGTARRQDGPHCRRHRAAATHAFALPYDRPPGQFLVGFRSRVLRIFNRTRSFSVMLCPWFCLVKFYLLFICNSLKIGLKNIIFCYVL